MNLNKAWRRIRARSGLHDVRLHDLRRTAAMSEAIILMTNKDDLIVVAGGGGFIGGHLVADLLRRVQAMATQSNLTIRGFEPQAVASRDLHAEWPIELQLEGRRVARRPCW